MTREVQDALRRMGDRDHELYLEELRAAERRERRHARHRAVALDKWLRSYHEDHPGHPLGPGYPLGEPIRGDESHGKGWMAIIRRDPCGFCGRLGGTVDHIVPRSSGKRGLHDWTNYAGACDSCNLHKGTLPLLEYLLRRRGVAMPQAELTRKERRQLRAAAQRSAVRAMAERLGIETPAERARAA